MARDVFQTSYEPRVAAGIGLIEKVRNFTLRGKIDSLTLDTETDISPEATPLVFPAFAGEALEIVSDNAADTDTIRISGLDANMENFITADVVLNGITPVAIPGLFSRVNTMASIGQAGFAGLLTVRPAGGGATYISALAADQRSYRGAFSIPAGSTWIIGQVIGGLQKITGAAGEVNFSVLIKKGQQAIFGRAFDFVLTTTTAPNVVFSNGLPTGVEGPSDMKVSANSSTTGVAARSLVSGQVFEGYQRGQ